MPSKQVPAVVDEAQPQQEDEQTLAEQYAIWQKNVKLLYDLVISKAVEWPSLTLQWMPDKEIVGDKGYSRHRLLLGTYTSGEDIESLQIAEVKLPLPETDLDNSTFEALDKKHAALIASTEGRIDVKQTITHAGEVNRARYMPQKPNIVATKSPSADVFIFDLDAHPARPVGKSFKPNMKLTGHKKEGFGLSWSPFQSGLLLSGSNDHQICVWDTAKGGKSLAATSTYAQHSDAVNDVMWHNTQPDVFGSVSDDKLLMLWDHRQAASTSQVTAHDAAVNALAFHPRNSYLLATGGADSSIALFDQRKLSQKLHSMEGHKADIKILVWSPHNDTILASAANDRKVILWDLARIGEEQSEEDADDGAPEMLFVHSGHSATVEDVAWNVTEPWVLASIDNDNLLQIWQPAENIYDE